MSLSDTLRFIAGHPLNRDKPLRGLGDFAKWQIRSRFQDEVVVDWVDGAKLAARRGMTGATGNIYCGLHEYVDMRFVLDLMRPGHLFVDVGANVGSYTILAAKVCGADVLAVEPGQEAGKALDRNIAVNGLDRQVTVARKALGAEHGTVLFTCGRDTTNRIATDADTATRTVEVTTLDALLEGRTPTLVKIDVEGHEEAVLEGAERTLAQQDLVAVISEGTGPGVTRLLNRNGFKRRHYDPKRRKCHGEPALFHSNNGLFVRDDETVNRMIGNSAPCEAER